jgi:DNA primase
MAIDSNNICDLLSHHHIPYIQSGNNVLIRCLNPSHKDTRPSMSIHKDKGIYQCFSCGVKGGYPALYKLITGYSLYEKDDIQTRFPTVRKPSEYSSIKTVGNLYNPLHNPDIMEWLRINGVEDDCFIRDYGMTYSKYTEMIADNLIIDDPQVSYTKMRERICSPIIHDGKTINVEGRTVINEEPKVLYVKGGSVETLYNWNRIDKEKDVIIVEGIKDLWRVWNVEKNVVAMFHSLPTKKQFEMLNEVKGNLIFFLDNDHGGKGVIDKIGTCIRDGTFQKVKKELNRSFRWIMPKGEGNDPNDCSYSEIERLLKNPHTDKLNPNIRAVI